MRTRRTASWFLASWLLGGLYSHPALAQDAGASAPVATGQLVILSEPNAALISVDGTELGPAPAVARNLVPGDHLVVAVLNGQRSEQIARVEAGISRSVRMVLTTAPVAPPPPPVVSPTPPAPPPPTPPPPPVVPPPTPTVPLVTTFPGTDPPPSPARLPEEERAEDVAYPYFPNRWSRAALSFRGEFGIPLLAKFAFANMAAEFSYPVSSNSSFFLRGALSPAFFSGFGMGMNFTVNFANGLSPFALGFSFSADCYPFYQEAGVMGFGLLGVGRFLFSPLRHLLLGAGIGLGGHIALRFGTNTTRAETNGYFYLVPEVGASWAF